MTGAMQATADWLALTLVLILFLAFFVGGIACTILHSIRIWRYRNSHKWPHCAGKLKVLKIKKYVTRGKYGKSVRWGLETDYEFELNGTTYRSNTVGVSDTDWVSRKTAEKAKKKIEYFGRGKREVRVYYNPDSPDLNYLLQNGNWGNVYMVLAGILITLAFGWILWTAAVVHEFI
ncbi:MAG: DUF3592 domain-containing protein [Planctomycetota bacterium]